MISNVNFDNVTDPDKKAMLEIANKSQEISKLVVLFNEWHEMITWPGDMKLEMKWIELRVAANMDLLEAQVRSMATTEMHTKTKTTMAQRMGTQALLKTNRGSAKNPALAVRASPCQSALDRATEWKVTLPASLAKALKMHTAGPPMPPS